MNYKKMVHEEMKRKNLGRVAHYYIDEDVGIELLEEQIVRLLKQAADEERKETNEWWEGRIHQTKTYKEGIAKQIAKDAEIGRLCWDTFNTEYPPATDYAKGWSAAAEEIAKAIEGQKD